MTALIGLITGKAPLILGGIAAIAAWFTWAFSKAFSAGKNSQIAKEAKADAKTLDDIAKANAAAARAATGGLHDDDGFKRKP